MTGRRGRGGKDRSRLEGVRRTACSSSLQLSCIEVWKVRGGADVCKNWAARLAHLKASTAVSRLERKRRDDGDVKEVGRRSSD